MKKFTQKILCLCNKMLSSCVVSTHIYSGVYIFKNIFFRGLFFQGQIYSGVYLLKDVFIQGYFYSKMYLFWGIFIQGYIYSGVFNFSMCGNSAIGFCSVCAC